MSVQFSFCKRGMRSVITQCPIGKSVVAKHLTMLSSLDWGRHEDALPEPLRGRTCCPAGKGVMGREPPASHSFRVCLSREEPDACSELCSSQGCPRVVNELAGVWRLRSLALSGVTLTGRVSLLCNFLPGGPDFPWSASQCLFPLLNPASSPFL